MTLHFILNGEDVVAHSAGDTRLTDILRDNFGLLGAKTGCCTGLCSSCSIIFNGNVVKSCLIPAFKVSGSEIITIEGFSQTDEYQDIVFGFSEAELENCGFCNTAKVLATETLLEGNHRLSKETILSAFYGIRCRCTEPEELVRGVMAVIDYRRSKLYGRR
jgi:carbon-monoxide dehydrogenase small subunit